ncbi:MAG: hypothetical protein IKL99_01120 [Oscillospiraceae bacterium]|nr:hypothetical protein [Oscillospiraceae bacterium]
MMKLLGGILFFASGVLLRCVLVEQKRREIRMLRETILSLQMLRQRLYATLQPLPKLLAGVSEERNCCFFTAVCRCYAGEPDGGIDSAWHKTPESLPMDFADREIVKSLADAFSAPEELLRRGFESALEQLQNSLDEKERRRGKDERLTTALCISGNIILLVFIV